jgi:hypothetical protein
MSKRKPTRLSRPIRTRDGTILTTVLDATRYILSLPENDVLYRNSWIKAAQLIHDGADPEAITKQIEGALFLEAKLDLRAN